MFAKVQITGVIELVTGMHIGASGAFSVYQQALFTHTEKMGMEQQPAVVPERDRLFREACHRAFCG